ncbi:hypothetical protein K8R78_02220 [bacterium]|nr:hypothetical protein [bacterium]
MKKLPFILLTFLVLAVSAEVVQGYAYPTPWEFGDTPLTLRADLTSVEAVTFTLLDQSGNEVLTLSGEYQGEETVDGETVYRYEAQWDGLNAAGRAVVAGSYLCVVEGGGGAVFRLIVTR